MKYFLKILLLVSFSGCLPKPFATKKMFIPYAFDFTKYAEQGFLFTPLELIDRPYAGRGMIHIDGFPEVKQTTEYFEHGTGISPKTKLVPGKVDPDEMIANAYELAKAMGADAIISFKMSSRPGMSHGYVNVDILELSGFAIKRL